MSNTDTFTKDKIQICNNLHTINEFIDNVMAYDKVSVGISKTFKIYKNMEEFILDFKKENKSQGFVYILECADSVKIGCSKNPVKRIQYWTHILKSYGGNKIGRFSVSIAHTNYYENEKILHKIFDSVQIRDTELFGLDFDEAMDIINNSIIKILNFENNGFKLENEKNQKSKNFFDDLIKSYTKGIKIDFYKMTENDIDHAIELIELYKESRENLVEFLYKFKN